MSCEHLPNGSRCGADQRVVIFAVGMFCANPSAAASGEGAQAIGTEAKPTRHRLLFRRLTGNVLAAASLKRLSA